MIYAQANKRRWPKRLVFVLLFTALFLVVATGIVRYVYNQNLAAVSTSEETILVLVESGATVDEVSKLLEKKKVIRSAWAFRLYVSSKEMRSAIQAGEYELQPRMSVGEIVSVLTHGKVATNLVTIIPGKRIDQIRQRLIEEGFPEADVDKALDPKTYAGNPALVDKPEQASLEGYIYPDSYQKTSATTATDIVESALLEMRKKLTPDLRSAFAKQGLSTYQAIVLASVVEKEVPSSEERAQAAQVFLKRLRIGMRLESDATNHYYSTYRNDGLPPTPISNVTKSSLEAVANPASTDWLYFVSGDDGITRFSNTLAEHEAKVQQTCTKLCGR